MTKEEYLDLHYPGLKWIDLSETCKSIQHALWDAYDDKGEIVDVLKFKIAFNNCVPIYNKLKEHEDQIRIDLDEYNGKHGTPVFCPETLETISTPIQDMSFICDTYHKYFESIDISLFIDNHEATECQDNIDISDVVNYKDEDLNHRKWFVKILDSKIPDEEKEKDQIIIKDKDQILYNCLKRLYDELCNWGCFTPDKEDKSVFIYRFSGFNGSYPIERKIIWKKENVFLGYIVRCLISDKWNAPMDFGTAASFFTSETGKPMNLASAKNYNVENYEEQKRKKSLPIDFINAVELLKKSGFINVEFTSARR